jgi:hypothetical protein
MDLDIRFTRSILTFYDEMLRSGISLVYFGEFSQGITKMFTSMAEESMERSGESKSVQRKVYHVMVETLQNMNKHSDELAEMGDTGRGLFIIGKDEEYYYVMTSNKIEKDKVAPLQEMIERINAASKAELKEMYLNQIKNGTISPKGGAGLGLIDIARKTGQKFHYLFLPLDETYEFFLLKVQIMIDDK